MKRRDLILGIAGTALLLPTVTLGGIGSGRPLPKERGKFQYRILCGGSEVGQHTVAIISDTSGLIRIEHHRKLKVGFLFIPLYALKLRSEELWDGPTLKTLHAEGTENGQDFLVEGCAVEDRFIVHCRGEDFVAPGNLATTESFWGAWALNKPHLIDTVKGKVVQPTVRPLEEGRWRLQHGRVKADIRFDGDFMVEADVNRDGHLVRFVRANSVLAAASDVP